MLHSNNATDLARRFGVTRADAQREETAHQRTFRGFEDVARECVGVKGLNEELVGGIQEGRRELAACLVCSVDKICSSDWSRHSGASLTTGKRENKGSRSSKGYNPLGRGMVP